MKLTTLQFSGHFDEEDRILAQSLQLIEPENDLERNAICWAILPREQAVATDPAGGGLTFEYNLRGYLKNGLYRLHVLGRGSAGVEGEVEIAAALVATPAQFSGGRLFDFTPFWFISPRLHLRPRGESIHGRYLGDSYGHLRFGRSAVLPHRRLFPAPVGLLGDWG